MEKIISAVIGCGRMGAFTSESVYRYSPSCWLPLSHIEALQASNKIILDAICDSNENSLEKAKTAYRISHAYSDYHELLKEIKPELLSIATRTTERPGIIKDGIEMGVKAFHIEKPLCNSVEQLNDIEKIIKKNNIYLTYGTIRRHFPIYQQAKKIIQSGILGDLEQIQVNFGSSSLFWTHPHSVDLVLFFAGERSLLSTQAKLTELKTAKHPYYIESDPIVQSASMHFEGGLTGIISRTKGCDVILSCSEGELIIEADGRSIIRRETRGGDPYYNYPGTTIALDKQPESQGTYCAIEILLKELHEGKESSRQDDIFLGQRILFSFVQSSIQNSQLVTLTDIDPEIFVLGKTGNNLA